MAAPQQGVAYTFYVGLFDVANPGRIKTTPTIAAGDFKNVTDGVDGGNLNTLPSEVVAGSGVVLITLSAAEMGSGGPAGGSKIMVRCSDPDFQWSDLYYFIDAPE